MWVLLVGSGRCLLSGRVGVGVPARVCVRAPWCWGLALHHAHPTTKKDGRGLVFLRPSVSLSPWVCTLLCCCLPAGWLSIAPAVSRCRAPRRVLLANLLLVCSLRSMGEASCIDEACTMDYPLRFGVCIRRNRAGMLLPSFYLMVCRLLLVAYPLACPLRLGLEGLSGASPCATGHPIPAWLRTIALRRLLRPLILGGRGLGP